MEAQAPPQPLTVKEVQEKIDELYGDRHAKGLGDGLVKGAVSVGKGIFAGVGGLIAAPIAGAAAGGGKGFLKGAAVGIAGVVLLPTIGVVHGVRQVGSGVKNTPDNVRRMMNKDKNEEEAEKAEVVDDPAVESTNQKTYSLSREKVEQVAFDNPTPPPPPPASASASAGGATPPPSAPEATSAPPPPAPAVSSVASGDASGVYQGTETPKETEYYEVMGVATTATQGEIKKAYYKLAIRLHPDKNPGDETAHAKFSQLGEAYQILMDPAKREAYDKYGKDGLQEGTMDPRAFFNMAFGAEVFKPLIGELTLAHAAEGNMSQEEFKEWQVEREKALAKNLLLRLQPWLQGNEELFVKESLSLVEDLKKEDFAAPMLQCIGYTYYHKAEVCLGLQSMLGIPGYLNAVKLYGHNVKSQFKAVDAAVRLQEMKVQAEAGESSETALPDFLNAIWLITALDIESTVRHVVDIVIMDKSISKDERKKRARGVMRLGKVFLEA